MAAELKLSIFWAQAHLGIDYWYPYGCDGPDCDSETYMTAGAAGGVILFDVLAAGVGFRVYEQLTGDKGAKMDTQGVVDVIFKLTLGPVEPSLVLAFPLDKDTNDLYPASMSLGVAGRF